MRARRSAPGAPVPIEAAASPAAPASLSAPASSIAPTPADRDADDPWVEVGRVLGAFGVQGAMKVEPWSDPAESVLARVREWRLVDRDGGIVDLVVGPVSIRPDALVTTPEPVRSREAVQAWKGARLSVRRSVFPPVDDDEYYWADLVGCTVVTREGAPLGQVTAVLDLGADPLLQVDGRLLIPFVDAHVDDVDVAARRIVVDWAADWS